MYGVDFAQYWTRRPMGPPLKNHSKFSKTALWPQNFLRLRRAKRGFAFGTVPHSPESATLTVIIIPVTPDSSSKPMVVGTYMGVRGLLEYPRSPLCGSPKTARAPAPPSPVKKPETRLQGSPNASSPYSPPRQAGSLGLRGLQECVHGAIEPASNVTRASTS